MSKVRTKTNPSGAIKYVAKARRGRIRRFCAALASGVMGLTVLCAGASELVSWGCGWQIPSVTTVVRIASGDSHNLALLANGTVVAWGDNSYGQCDVPASVSNAVAVAAGAYHSLALLADGTVIAWGRNDQGQCNVPNDAANAVSVTAGGNHSVALLADGRVLAWGGNVLHECDVPESVVEAVAVVAGGTHSLAQLRNGQVVGWGDNGWGQINTPSNLADVVQVAAGLYYSVGLRSNGTFVVWGGNWCGMMENAVWVTNGVEVAAGLTHALVRLRDGTVSALGCNYYGEGNVPPALSNVLAVSAGAYHSLALVGDDTPDVSPPELFGVADMTVTAASPAGAHAYFGVRVRDDKDPWPRVFYSQEPGSFFGMGSHTVTVWAVDSAGHTNQVSWVITVIPDEEPPQFLDCGDREIFVVTSRYWKMESLVAVRDNGDPHPQVIYDPPLNAWVPVGRTTVVMRAWDASGNTNECSFALTLRSLPVWAWGANQNGQCDVPRTASNVVAVSAGHAHTLALCGDGTLLAWGDNSQGQCNVPPGLGDVTAISAGYYHNVVVRENGTVVAWGGPNYFGEQNVPVEATNGVAVSCGTHHTLLLRANGTVIAWGDNTYGQCDVPRGVADVVAVAAGGFHSLALRVDGTVVAWGQNDRGQCDVPADLSNVVAIAASEYISLAVTADGCVRVWGDSDGYYAVRQVPLRASNVVSAVAGNGFCAALRSDGEVVVWGIDAANVRYPDGMNNIVTLAAKWGHCVAIERVSYTEDENPPIIWGCNDYVWPATTPAGRRVICLPRVRDNTDPSPHVQAYGPPMGSVCPVGVWTAGWLVADAQGNTNHCNFTITIEPDTEAPIIGGCQNTTSVVWRLTDARLTNTVNVTDNASDDVSVRYEPAQGSFLSLGDNLVGVVAEDEWGNTASCEYVVSQFLIPIVSWGDNSSRQLDVPWYASNITQLAAGAAHSLALRSDGVVLAWGGNASGECDVPGEATNAVGIAAAGYHSLAVLENGRVLAWGCNCSGECNIPAELTNAVSVAAGDHHSLALDSEGRVWAWGQNNSGQVNVPGDLSNVVAIAAGNQHSAALLSDGHVIAWGNNWYGQCEVPSDVTNAVDISAGSYVTAARLDDGRVVVWGYNGYGQCNVPADLSNATQVVVGNWSCLARTDKGQLVGWGYYWDPIVLNMPTGLCHVAAVACGSSHALALLDAAPRVSRVTPTGGVVGGVTSLVVEFNVAVDPSSLDAADFSLNGPSGTLEIMGVVAWRDYVYCLFPAAPLTIEGTYILEVGTNITDYAGRGLAAGYTGAFHVVASVPEPPTLDGFLPVPNINLVRSLQYSIWNGWYLNVSGSRSDNTEVWLNGQLMAERGTGTWANAVYQLGEGDRLLRLWAVSEYGLSSATQQYHLLIDLNPPTVNLDYPPAYSNGIPASVRLSIRDGITGVDLSKSQFAVSRGGISVPGAWDVDVDRAIFTPSSHFVEGTYNVSFRVADHAGHTNEQTLSFTIDMTAPTPPTVNPVVTPTTINQQWIAGSREPDCAIFCNGQRVVDYSSGTNWSWWTGLQSGSNVFVFKAVDLAGNESAPVTVSIFYDDVPPGPVSVTAMVAWTGTKIMLGWSDYDELANGGDIASYHIYMYDQPFSHVSQATEIGTQYPGAKYFEVSGLERGVTRYFAVAARDVNNQMIPNVTCIGATPVDVWPPPNPINVRFQCGWTNIVMLWDVPPDPDSDLAGYRVYWAGDTNPYVLGVAETSFEVQELPRNTGFPIRITSMDVYGNESAGVTNMAVTLLENPGELVAKPYDHLVDLNWNVTEPTQYVARYDVYMDTAPFTSVGTRTAVVSVTTPFASVGGLQNNQGYYFAVAAVNLSGCWDTNVVSVNAMPMPDTVGPNLSNIFYNGIAIAQALPVRRPGNFSAEAWDRGGVSRIEFYVNGQKLRAVGSWTWESFWNVAETASNGLHDLVVKAYDSWNNQTTYQTNVTVELDTPETPVLLKPANGMAVNSRAVTLSGYVCNWATGITVYLNGAPVTQGGAVLDRNGGFAGWVEMPAGTNTLEVVAVNRAGESPRATATVIVDLSVPSAPIQLAATPRPDGVIQLLWASTVGAEGYNIYRATGPFSSTSQAERINGAYPWGGIAYSDVTPSDQTYYYRVAAVNRAGTEGPLSPQAVAAADRIAPCAEWVQYTPLGAYDAVRGVFGRGELRIFVKFNEPLQSEPFFSLNSPGAQPINVTLTRSSTNALLYSGSAIIGNQGVDGPVYAVLSARDMVGNRGTDIRTGSVIYVDMVGPALSALVLTPSAPVQMTSGVSRAVAVVAEFATNEIPVVTPAVYWKLSQTQTNWTPVEMVRLTMSTWGGQIMLPGSAGSPVEYLEFLYQGVDSLGNTGNVIRGEGRFQVYQGTLPPLDPPQQVAGVALPDGWIRISWASVPQASDYAVFMGNTSNDLAAFARSETTYWENRLGNATQWFAVASVRAANGQSVTGALSQAIRLEADAEAPLPPEPLALQITPSGLLVSWPTGSESRLTYRLYRDGHCPLSVTGMSPCATTERTWALDGSPVPGASYYVVTAEDPAGNVSQPSACAYTNLALVPPQSFIVRLLPYSFPILSWSHVAPAAIAGYNLYVGEDVDSTRIATLQASETQYEDRAFSPTIPRLYRIAARDIQGTNEVESLSRRVWLPALSFYAVPAIQYTPIGTGGLATIQMVRSYPLLKRGTMNSFPIVIQNRSGMNVSNARVCVQVAGRDHWSREFDVPGLATATVDVVVGGYTTLASMVRATGIVRIASFEGVAELVSYTDVAVRDDKLPTDLLYSEPARGAEFPVQFRLYNTSPEEIQIVTGENGEASPEIRVKLETTNGMVLSAASLRQLLGDGVMTLPNGRTLATIQPGGQFTSQAVPLVIPTNAPDNVVLRLEIDKLHYRIGEPEEVEMDGLNSAVPVAVAETIYYAQVTNVAPVRAIGRRNVVIQGVAINRQTGRPQDNVPVRVVVARDGFETPFLVTADAFGNWSITYVPQVGESGVYQVWAVHPNVVAKPVQATFSLLNLAIEPLRMNVRTPKHYAQSLPVTLELGRELALTNVHWQYLAEDQPSGQLISNVDVVVTGRLATLQGGTAKVLPFSVIADSEAPSEATLVLRLTSDDAPSSGWGQVTAVCQFVESQPFLNWSPAYVEVGVAAGQSAWADLQVRNDGFVPVTGVSAKLTDTNGVALQNAWVTLASSALLGDVAPGSKVDMFLMVSPTNGTPEGYYEYRLLLTSSNDAPHSVPVYIAVDNSGRGRALFKVADIFTGTTNDLGQIVQGAAGVRIMLQRESGLAYETNGVTDAMGEWYVEDLPEGSYVFTASSGKHYPASGRLWVRPGITTPADIMLQNRLVTFEWSVREIALEDRYEIVLNAVFQTEVPAPVVVVEPTIIPLPEMQAGDVYNGAFALINHGLIEANVRKLVPPEEDGQLKFEYLARPQTLAPKQIMLVPFRVTCLANSVGESGGGDAKCSQTHKTVIGYDYVCINGQWQQNEIYAYFTRKVPCPKDQKGVPVPDYVGPLTGWGVRDGTGIGGPAQQKQAVPMGTACVPKRCPTNLPLVCCLSNGGSGGGASGGGGGGSSGGSGGSGGPSGPSSGDSTPCGMAGCMLNDTPRAPDTRPGPTFRTPYPPQPGVIYPLGVNAPVRSFVNLLTGEYWDHVQDISVKVAGGMVGVSRMFVNNAWSFEESFGSEALFPLSTNMAEAATSGAACVYYERDETGSIIGVRDHFTNLVLSLQYTSLLGTQRLVSVSDMTGRTIRYDYDSVSGRLTNFVNTLGQSVAYEYDAAGRLVGKTLPGGYHVTVEYNAYGQVAVCENQRYDYAYDVKNGQHYASVRQPDGFLQEFWFDESGTMIREAINGNVVVRPTNRVESIGADRPFIIIGVAAGGSGASSMSRSVDRSASVVLISDYVHIGGANDSLGWRVTRPDGSVWRYSAEGLLLSVNYPNGLSEHFQYSGPYKQRSAHTDTRGLVTEWTYDAYGRVTQMVYAAGTDIGYRYLAAYDEIGNMTSYVWVGEADGTRLEWAWRYDEYGNPVETRNPWGKTQTNEFDVMGNLLRSVSSDGSSWSYTFDADGRLTSTTDPLGRVTSNRYDAAGRLVWTRNVAGNEIEWSYTPDGRILSVTNSLGDWTAYSYDRFDRPVAAHYASGESAQWSYTSDGIVMPEALKNAQWIQTPSSTVLRVVGGDTNITAELVFNRITSELESLTSDQQRLQVWRDFAGNVTQAVTVAAGRTLVTVMERDAYGQIIRISAPAGRTAEYRYDSFGRMTNIIWAIGTEHYSYTNGTAGRAVRDALGHEIRFDRDFEDLTSRTRHADGTTETVEQDQATRKTVTIKPSGQRVERYLDVFGRMTNVSFFVSTNETTPARSAWFVYDDHDRLIGYGWQGEYPVVSIEYDDTQRVQTVTTDYGAFQKTIIYSNDWNGQKTAMKRAEGTWEFYRYDHGALVGVDLGSAGIIAFEQLSSASVSRVVFPGGVTVEKTINDLGWCVGQRARTPGGSIFYEAFYAHNDAGQVTNARVDGQTVDYVYDAAGRLTGAFRTGIMQETYQLDAAHNRVGYGGASNSWVYDEANRLLAWPGGAMAYNADGLATSRVTTAASLRFEYDAAGNLCRVRNDHGAVIAEYTYDPLGRRISKTVGGQTTWFLYSGVGIVAEYDATGGLLRAYGYMPGSDWMTAPLYQQVGGACYWYINDFMGAPVCLVDSSGTIVWRVERDPFGGIVSNLVNAVNNPLTLSGQYYDEETGLHYNTLRYYDPLTGRYLTPDPIGYYDGWNRYVFVTHDPVNRSDVLGLWDMQIHYYGTFLAALLAGKSCEEAENLGCYALWPDIEESGGKAGWGITERKKEINSLIHQLSGAAPDVHVCMRTAIKDLLRKTTDSLLRGLLAHALADTFAHTTYSSDYPDFLTNEPYGPGVGHGYDAHWPDVVGLRPTLAKMTLETLFYSFGGENPAALGPVFDLIDNDLATPPPTDRKWYNEVGKVLGELVAIADSRGKQHADAEALAFQSLALKLAEKHRCPRNVVQRLKKSPQEFSKKPGCNRGKPPRRFSPNDLYPLRKARQCCQDVYKKQ